MVVTREQNIFVAPWIGPFWVHSLAVGLSFAENGPQGIWRYSGLCDVVVFIFIWYIKLIVN